MKAGSANLHSKVRGFSAARNQAGFSPARAADPL
jgi:hypothetical protein